MVRHAETPWVVEDRFQGRADTRLSKRGEAQALIVAGRLARPGAPPPLPLPDTPPLAIWHSPLERAAATARAIATAQGRPDIVRPSPELIELDVGEWEGLTNTEVMERWPDQLAAWRRDPTVGLIPGGEPAAQGAVRVRRAIEALVTELEIASEQGSAWTIAVSHDGILRVLLLELLGLPLERYWSFPMAAAGITIVDRVPDGPWRLRLHGLTASIDEEAPATGPGA
jgi:probable phosphoglycerate mutase